MAQSKEQILNKVTEFCNKGKFNFTATSLDKFSEESVKLFDAPDAKEEDVYSSLENQLTTSYKMMSSGLAAVSETHRKEKTALEAQIAELKKTQTQTTPPITPQPEKPDVAEALKSLGLDADELKKMIEMKKSNEANEKIIAHTKSVIEGALKNVPESRKDDFNRFVIGRAFYGSLEDDVKKLNSDFKESIKDYDDIDIEVGGGSADEKAKYANLYSAMQRNVKAKKG